MIDKINKKGFTLIELLVSITIGMVLIGFGSVALNDFNEKQKIETTKQELLGVLRLARNYAITNQLNPNANRIIVVISQDGTMTIVDDKGKSFFNKDISPNGITITTPATINFSVNDGKSILENTLVGTTVVVVVTGDDGSAKTINIDESGLIYEK